MTWIRDKFAAFSDHIACHEAGRTYSFADFLELIKQAAAGLPETGRQVIEIQTATTIEGLATLLAVAECGHIALPLPAELPANAQTQMRQVAAHSPLYNQLEGSGLILFSSGTSGEPKGMLHHLDALLNRYRTLNERQDRSLLLLLIDHIGGLDSAFRCLFAGSTLVIPETRSPEAAGAAIAEHKVNVLPASPTFLNLMLLNRVTESHDLGSIEIIAYGAEAMPPSVLRRLAKAFPKAQLQQKFGTSETGAVRTQSADNQSLFFRIVDSDTDWKVVDEELWLRTPSRILGYLNAKPDNLEADGWYATGDLVETGEDDTIRIIGRAGAVINVGGQKVHPTQVEAVLNEVEGIEACFVYGQNDPITGSAVACSIVVNEEQDLRAWKRRIRQQCRGKLAPWMIPSTVVISPHLKVTDRLKRSIF